MTEAASRLIRSGSPQSCHPHERYLLRSTDWDALPDALRQEPALELLGLWAEPGLVHAAFLKRAAEGGAPARLLLASAPLREGRFAALSPARPGAALFERAARDLWGASAQDGGGPVPAVAASSVPAASGATPFGSTRSGPSAPIPAVDSGASDPRPWLDHGRWLFDRPLAAVPVRRSAPPPQPEFRPPPEGEGLHQLALGPVRAGIAEPAHLRLDLLGERVTRLEARLGYAHKGTLGLIRGKSPRGAARFAARLSGVDAVAHGWAFAMAAEAAAGRAVPPRATVLRGVLAELERVANHLDAWAAACRAAGAGECAAAAARLREILRRAIGAAFGHRLAMDVVVPGGLAADLMPEGEAALRAALEVVAAGLAALPPQPAPAAERLGGAGRLPLPLAEHFAAGGVVGRASGRDFDARRDLPYAPYDRMEIPRSQGGDAAARLALRLAEARESLQILPLLLDALPEGEIAIPLPARAGEGAGVVEGARGEVLHWLSLDGEGLVRACFVRDPSWLHWPLLEAVMEGSELADFPLCEHSFGLTCSGVDL
ncbi:Formate hydrogenlyase subunit 5 [Roseomonas mucosa]|uniref:hydrogenase large subunit n=1 Tax=Roseomonas mucosa TaxID=207340 RepID=UPI002203FC08|nr:hydrogenase expression protein HypE [Roseomonas mucosa]QDJ08437.1 Formate hydrogenlyase subunit 5 [Roseomonas mucosa]